MRSADRILREVRSGSTGVLRARYDRVASDAGAAAAFRLGMQVEIAVVTNRAGASRG